MITFSHVSVMIGLAFIAFAFYRLRAAKPSRKNCYYDEKGMPVMWKD